MYRVCHLTSVHSARDVRIFYKMCVSLAAAGYDTWLVAPGESFNEKGVHVSGVQGKPKSRVKRMLWFTRKIYSKGLDLNADLYHIHDPELLPYGLKLKRKGKKVIFDSHEDYNNIVNKYWIPKPFRHIMSQLYLSYERYVIGKLDYVISVTPHICERLKKENPNVEMICNFPVIPKELPQMPNFNNRKIVFTGGIVKKWSHDIVLTAISQLLDVTYVLCGKIGNELYFNNLKANPNWDKVEYKGFIPHNQIPIIHNKCYAGMAISQSDVISNWDKRTYSGTYGNTKLFEYMMAGLPVICTDYVLWKGIIENNKCGICVNASDVTQIRDAIDYLLNHPNEAQQMGENGRRAVVKQYNWSNEEIKLLNLYTKVLSDR